MAWYEEDLGGGWCIAYRLIAQGTTCVLGEVRILPAEQRSTRSSGEWSGNETAVPAGGLTDTVVKALRAAAACCEDPSYLGTSPFLVPKSP